MRTLTYLPRVPSPGASSTGAASSSFLEEQLKDASVCPAGTSSWLALGTAAGRVRRPQGGAGGPAAPRGGNAWSCRVIVGAPSASGTRQPARQPRKVTWLLCAADASQTCRAEILAGRGGMVHPCSIWEKRMAGVFWRLLHSLSGTWTGVTPGLALGLPQ